MAAPPSSLLTEVVTSNVYEWYIIPTTWRIRHVCNICTLQMLHVSNFSVTINADSIISQA